MVNEMGVDEYGSVVPMILKANPPNSSCQPLTLNQVRKRLQSRTWGKECEGRAGERGEEDEGGRPRRKDVKGERG
jgi:hypothetical protein